MMFPTLVVSAFLAASTLVQASPVLPRGNTDTFVSGFLAALNKAGLTTLSTIYKDCFNSNDCGPPVEKLLKSGVLTLLAPENNAFDSNHPSIGDDPTSILSYNTIFGSIDTGFQTSNSSVTRRTPNQSRSLGSSGFSSPGMGSRKRGSGLLEGHQVQVVDQVVTGGRKRWSSGSLIRVDRSVGSATVVGRSTFKKIIILAIDAVLTLPTAVSDLLCKSLIDSTPNGFVKFGGALQKTDLLDKVDNTPKITIFAPTDDAFDEANIDGLSNDDLSYVLRNHFFFGLIAYGPLFPSISTVTADSGQQLKLRIENNVKYVSCGGSEAIVLRSDVAARNGVMHVIDKVLKCH